MAAQQPRHLSRLPLHNNTTDCASSRRAQSVRLSLILPLRRSPLPVLSSLHISESLRSCLQNQNGCVCRGREEEGMRGRQRCWKSERWGGRVRGGEGRRIRAARSSSDVTSAVSSQDAAMCHTGEGGPKRFVCQHESRLFACVHRVPCSRRNDVDNILLSCLSAKMQLWAFNM